MDIDLTLIAGIWMGGLVLLVPLLGAAARFGVVPVLDAVARLRQGGGDAELQARLERVESRLAQLAETMERQADRRAA